MPAQCGGSGRSTVERGVSATSWRWPTYRPARSRSTQVATATAPPPTTRTKSGQPVRYCSDQARFMSTYTAQERTAKRAVVHTPQSAAAMPGTTMIHVIIR
ncbi:hypothetical protein [Streptomyces sp. NEAU-H3]|uniref:hypothetical protein n=1 Tax=Streptomyces sp. NEAU-H3 TaxID=2720636 RepID=UPI001FD72565|nr:hypothetical protein [Streptomyces sp. NEAU-H3]